MFSVKNEVYKSYELCLTMNFVESIFYLLNLQLLLGIFFVFGFFRWFAKMNKEVMKNTEKIEKMNEEIMRTTVKIKKLECWIENNECFKKVVV